jgi:ketosteroid isomerase-like protein
MHPNERLLRREYESRARDDLASLEPLFDEEIIWHVPGRNRISGTYRGRDEVFGYIRGRQGLANGTFRINVEHVLANDDYGLVIAWGQAERGGQKWHWRGHGVYRFHGGKIAECWLVPEDQDLFDRIWS